MNAQLTANNFWDTDLADLDRILLGDNVKIMDLATELDDRVPPQGSVLLDRVELGYVKPSLFEKLSRAFRL